MKIYLTIAAISLVLAVTSYGASPTSDPLSQVLGELKTTTLDTAAVRQLAGTDSFKEYSHNPVLSPGPAASWDAGALGSMSVIKVGKIFHLYYEAWGVRGRNPEDYRSLQIGHAVSLDGIHWAKDPANPVLRKGAPGEWDHDGTWDPFVIYEDGVFKFWYGGGMDSHCDWGYAESKDGREFVKKGQISHLGNVEDDHIVHDPITHRYYMYYWDRHLGLKGLRRAVGEDEKGFDFDHAISLTIAGEPPGVYKFSHVVVQGDTWYMFYGDARHQGCRGSTVRQAVSKDGVAWRSVNKRLVVGHDGELLRAEDDLYLLYYGRPGHFDAKDCDIRVALYAGKLEPLIERAKDK